MPQLTKRVTMIELFYDLVFAYMISQATSLIHHLSHGTVSPISFLIVKNKKWLIWLMASLKKEWRSIVCFKIIDMKTPTIFLVKVIGALAKRAWYYQTLSRLFEILYYIYFFAAASASAAVFDGVNLTLFSTRCTSLTLTYAPLS